MGVPVTGVPDCVLRSVILYLTTKNKTTRKIYRKVCETISLCYYSLAECFTHLLIDFASCFIFCCQVKDYRMYDTVGTPVTGTPSFNCLFFAPSCHTILKFLQCCCTSLHIILSFCTCFSLAFHSFYYLVNLTCWTFFTV